MFKHGINLLFTFFLSVALTGCFGGGGSSKADAGSGDRSTKTGDSGESSLQTTDAFSVEAGEKYLHTDPSGIINLVGTISHPDSVEIVESYWRTFTIADGFQRIQASVSPSDADNVYEFRAGRYLTETVHFYQFVAIDTKGRAAVDDVYIRISPYVLSLDAALASKVVTEGESFAIALTLDEVLAEDLTLQFALESGSATIGEDVVDCSPCHLTIAAGESRGILTLETLLDDTEEAQESFRLVLLNHSEALDDGLNLELLIDDAQRGGVEIVSFVSASMTVAEKAGRISIPIIVEDAYQGKSNLELESRALVDAKPVVAVSYGGNAKGDTDFTPFDGHAIYYDADNDPYLVLDITDDTESEGLETVTLTLSANEFYDVGEQDTISIIIESDDVSLIASATDAYCTVEDHVDIRCWGDFQDGKTATPPLGTVRKLVGASDYFCAIHTDDGADRLECWGNVPGGPVDVSAPDDIVALNDRWCELRDITVTCYGSDFISEDTGVSAIAGGHQGMCFLGDAVECTISDFSFEVYGLLRPGSQFIYGLGVLDDGVRYPVVCARDFDIAAQVGAAACDGVPLPDTLMNPVAMAAVNLDLEVYVCLIDETLLGNELVCVNRAGATVDLFAGRNIEEPYGLSSDFKTHICVTHLNGVECLEWDGVREQRPLISMQATGTNDISGGFQLGTRNPASSLCGTQQGDLYCEQPGYSSPLGPLSLGDVAITRLDFQYSMPAVASSQGDLFYYQDFGKGISRDPVELPEPLTADAPFASGNGFVCYKSAGHVNCLNYGENGINTAPGSSVDGAVALAAGRSQACALVNNRVSCWGSGDPAEPFAVARIADDFVAMDYAGQSGCAVTDASRLYCWGYITEFLDTFGGLAFNVGTVEAVATADRRVCVQGDQGVRCWSARSAASVEINADDLTDITVTDDFACILDNKRTRCWGDYQDQLILL